MDGLTSEKATEMIGNRFDLILIASLRARELERGGIKKIDTNRGNCVTAIQEIEKGKVGREYLEKLRKR